VTSEDVIASGFPERTDPAALVVGPTGVALGEEGTLYVADTQGNRIAAVPGALSRHDALGEGGETIAKGGYLNDPLGMTLSPTGDLLTVNAGDGNIVETTPAGAEFQPFETSAGAGGLFGLTVASNLKGVYFVNDAENSLDLLH
jgi:DNA-binding beta-propeller fold protein YncE